MSRKINTIDMYDQSWTLISSTAVDVIRYAAKLMFNADIAALGRFSSFRPCG